MGQRDEAGFTVGFSARSPSEGGNGVVVRKGMSETVSLLPGICDIIDALPLRQKTNPARLLDQNVTLPRGSGQPTHRHHVSTHENP